MIDIIMAVMICFIVLLLLGVANMMIKLIIKQTAEERKGKELLFLYHGIIRRVPLPLLTESQYFDRYPNTNDMSYCPTIDDKAVAVLANTLNERFEGKSDRYKAGYILAMVQQNCRYVRDPNEYGVRDKWQFPVCTLYKRTGDCEDSAFLGVCLCKLCGLDVVSVYVRGHMAYAVNVPGYGVILDKDGKKYIWCESTSVFSMGIYSGTQEMLKMVPPRTPYAGFIAERTIFEDFDKY